MIFFFRFKKNDFTRLVAALQLPDNYVCKQRTLCSGFEGLMILLRRLSYPNRWCDLVHLFGRKETELCLIFNEVLFLYLYRDDLYYSILSCEIDTFLSWCVQTFCFLIPACLSTSRYQKN